MKCNAGMGWTGVDWGGQHALALGVGGALNQGTGNSAEVDLHCKHNQEPKAPRFWIKYNSQNNNG